MCRYIRLSKGIVLKCLTRVHFIWVNYISINKSISEEKDQDANLLTEGELATCQAVLGAVVVSTTYCSQQPRVAPWTCVPLVHGPLYAGVGAARQAHMYTHSFPNSRASAGRHEGAHVSTDTAPGIAVYQHLCAICRSIAGP